MALKKRSGVGCCCGALVAMDSSRRLGPKHLNSVTSSWASCNFLPKPGTASQGSGGLVQRDSRTQMDRAVPAEYRNEIMGGLSATRKQLSAACYNLPVSRQNGNSAEKAECKTVAKAASKIFLEREAR